MKVCIVCQKEVQEEEAKMLEKESLWEAPAFLKKNKGPFTI